MRKARIFAALTTCLLAGGASLWAQQPPQATDLPGSPYFIKNSWVLGGTGNWDYLTMDAEANRLYIAHGQQVQVVDVETGTLAGTITGLHGAHAIALDRSGEFGYISDGPANTVVVFDRRSYQVVGTIATGPVPRALAIDPQTGLLFAICTNPLTATQEPPSGTRPRPGARPSPPSRPAQASNDREIKTSISVIDLQARRRVGEILMPGKLGYAESDGNGQIFVLIVDRNQVARLDAQVIATMLHAHAEASPSPAASSNAEPPAPQANATEPANSPMMLDWSHEAHPTESGQEAMRVFSLGSSCQEPRSLAVDGAHQRLFAACNNMKLAVLNAGSGETVASLPIGPGTDAVGYDAARGLIYSANGGAQGTLTIIRQDVTDTYAEIENLPTRQQARTLAINPSTGQVYVVTDFNGVDLAKQGGIGTLKSVPVEGSFQVLVIGN